MTDVRTQEAVSEQSMTDKNRAVVRLHKPLPDLPTIFSSPFPEDDFPSLPDALVLTISANPFRDVHTNTTTRPSTPTATLSPREPLTPVVPPTAVPMAHHDPATLSYGCNPVASISVEFSAASSQLTGKRGRLRGTRKSLGPNPYWADHASTINGFNFKYDRSIHFYFTGTEHPELYLYVCEGQKAELIRNA